jgi:hypothetical protein
MPDLPLTGGCLCGGVRFEVTAPLLGAGYCHCKRCQRRTGTAAAYSAAAEPGSLHVTAGDELVKTYWPPQGGWGKAFCAECGSALWSVAPDDPQRRGVRMGAFDHDPGVRAQFHQWLESAAPWEPVPDDGLPRFQQGRSS